MSITSCGSKNKDTTVDFKYIGDSHFHVSTKDSPKKGEDFTMSCSLDDEYYIDEFEMTIGSKSAVQDQDFKVDYSAKTIKVLGNSIDGDIELNVVTKQVESFIEMEATEYNKTITDAFSLDINYHFSLKEALKTGEKITVKIENIKQTAGYYKDKGLVKIAVNKEECSVTGTKGYFGINFSDGPISEGTQMQFDVKLSKVDSSGNATESKDFTGLTLTYGVKMFDSISDNQDYAATISRTVDYEEYETVIESETVGYFAPAAAGIIALEDYSSDLGTAYGEQIENVSCEMHTTSHRAGMWIAWTNDILRKMISGKTYYFAMACKLKIWSASDVILLIPFECSCTFTFTD